MAIIQGNAKQGSTRGFYPKVINGSLRFNDDDSAYLSWTPASAGNRKTWTYSVWFKRANLSDSIGDFLLYENPTGGVGADHCFIYLKPDNALRIGTNASSSVTSDITTSMLFRDPSSWYHLVVQFDTTETTNTDRIKVYVNGQRITDFSSATWPSLNADLNFNTANPHYIGYYSPSPAPFDGYMANVHFIDGQALTADDFGELKNGVWVAKDYAGTFGTNGFYLTFEDDTQVEAFNTVLYRGNGGIQSVTGTGFAPDLVWIKERNGTDHHRLQDTVRGAGYRLYSSTTSAEGYASGSITSFDSDGFTVGSSLAVNESGNSYVAWCWKAGDSNVSNTDGTITSTVRANDTYGFSIVSYTGTGANATVGHGLSSAPDLVIVKSRTHASSWRVWITGFTGDQYLTLDTTNAVGTQATAWNSTTPTSSVFSLGSAGDTNSSGNDFIAYCWAEKAGYSKFGSYTGNGSATGPSVTDLGFKPAWIMIKAISSGTTERWCIHDNTRTVANGNSNVLFADDSLVENTSLTYDIDFLDNGFQVKTSHESHNQDTKEYIYAAFADTREAAFWLDQSGNDNDWQPVNLDHNDTVADSPTDNFATWNPLDKDTGITLSDGNLQATAADSASHSNVRSTIALPSSGKFYAEFRYTTTIAGSTAIALGLADETVTLTGIPVGQSGFWGIYSSTSTNFYTAGSSTTAVSTGSTGDILQIAYDADAEKMWYGLNNSWYDSSGGTTGNPSTGANPTASSVPNGLRFIGDVVNSGGQNLIANFGQQPFKYDPPA